MVYTKSAWTPFAGMKVRGSVKRVVLRGQIAMVDGKVGLGLGLGFVWFS